MSERNEYSSSGQRRRSDHPRRSDHHSNSGRSDSSKQHYKPSSKRAPRKSALDHFFDKADDKFDKVIRAGKKGFNEVVREGKKGYKK